MDLFDPSGPLADWLTGNPSGSIFDVNGGLETLGTNTATPGAEWWNSPVDFGKGPGLDFLGNPLPGSAYNLGNTGLDAAQKLVKYLSSSGATDASKKVASSMLSRITGMNPDLTQLLGTAGSTLAGLIGSNNQTNTIQGIYDQQRADRAPALAAYNSALSNPDSWYTSAPAMGAADAAGRALSVGGNPAANPGAISKLAANQLGGYNQYLSGLSGPAFGGQSTQAQLGTSLAGSQGNLGTILGGGITAATTPTSDLATLLKQLKDSGYNLGNGTSF